MISREGFLPKLRLCLSKDGQVVIRRLGHLTVTKEDSSKLVIKAEQGFKEKNDRKLFRASRTT